MPRAFKIYAVLMSGLAVGALALTDWSGLLGISQSGLFGLFTLILLGIFSEHLALTFVVGKHASSASLIFLLFFASVLLFGPAATVLVALVTGGYSQFILARKPAAKAFFNIAQFVVVTSLSGLVYTLLGGASSTSELSLQMVPFVAFTLVMSSGNLLAAGVGISLIEGMSLRRVISRIFGPWGANLLYDVLVSPVAVLVAVLFVRFQVPGLILAAFTLFFIRRSYLTNYQLQQANRDLLEALVKAIETRDPYTSGHSVRVSSLASRIVKQMGIYGRRAEEIESAALLHDIGKIDQIYVDILSKEGTLSTAERRVIESHASKGADMLRSLASVPDDVVRSVRHHHERVDGKGYPDQLVGDEIPLGARVIKVCDAIDAMLSHRPYRRALSLPAVKEQLSTYSGKQFDERVVAVIIDSALLSEYAAELEEKFRPAPMSDAPISISRPRERLSIAQTEAF